MDDHDLTKRLEELSAEKRALLFQRLKKKKEQEKGSFALVHQSRESNIFPVSFAQQRLWFLDQWEPNNAVYNIPLAWHMRGHLNFPALTHSLNEIVRRHEALRTTFATVDDQLVQVIASALGVPLPVVDLHELAEAEREARARRLAVEEAGRPFDLAQGPLLRASLVKMGEEEHILLLTMHHIVSDGWSADVFNRELAVLYRAFSSGQPSPLPELPIQYADFAVWQREWLQGQVLETQLAYWRRHLAGTPPRLELPTDRPRPPMQTYQGALRSFTLPHSLSGALKALSRREGATLFMTLLAAFETLLYRYTGQTDIVVGSPIANRNRAEIEGLIGFFVNTLALRTDLSGNPTFQEAVRRVREVALEAYAHQDVPFEKLIEDLHLERDLSHAPLFQVMFTLQNVGGKAIDLPGLCLKPWEIDNGTVKFDLTLSMEESEQGLMGCVQYNTGLFEAATIGRLVGHFQTLLEGIVANPAQRLSELPVLAEAERRQVIVEWNATRAGYRLHQCIHELFEAQVAQSPDAVAVVFGDQNLTYRELNRRANQLAHYLQRLGVERETLVALCLERSPELLIGLLGVLKAGGAYVPLDPMYPRERLIFMLEDSQAAVLVTVQRLAERLAADATQRVCLDADWLAISQENVETPANGVTADGLAYVLYTSGSTGRPKGVMITHQSVVNYLCWIDETFGDIAHTFPAITRPTFDASLKQLFAPLVRGREIWLLPDDVVAQPMALLQALGTRPGVGINCVPSLWGAVLDTLSASRDVASVAHSTCLLVGGEALGHDMVAQSWHMLPHLQIWNLYGPTEVTANASAARVVPGGRVTIGRPIANTQIYILDAHYQPAPIGVPGELCIGGVGLARGYLDRPELTAERFIPDPFNSDPGARLYRTGDLARYLPDGSIEFLGRIDHQVKLRGFRVELGEIESALGQHPAVHDRVVLLREDVPGHQHLVAYLVPVPGQSLAVDELRRFLKDKLPDYMIPSAFVLLEAFPLMPNGKLDRRALPAPDQRAAGSAGYIAPRTPLEESLTDIWRQVLGVEHVGIHDNFFELGGHSLLAVRLAARMRDRLGHSVSLVDLFKHPTIHDLARLVLNERPTSHGILHELTGPIPAGQKALSIVCVPYGGASAIVCLPLANALPGNCSLYAVQLPGHDYAYRDEALQPLGQVARRCVEEIRQTVSGPIALYGHCAGAALVIEMARLLEEIDVKVVGIFLGSALPESRLPSNLFEWFHKTFRPDRWVSDRAIYEELRALGGFTDMTDPDEVAFVVRSMRHDSCEAEDYYTAAYAVAHAGRKNGKLKAPILCIIGERDRSTELYEERFREWEFFSDVVDLASIPQAGHFFLTHQAGELARIVTSRAAAWQDDTARRPHLTTRGARPAGRREAEPGHLGKRRQGRPGRQAAKPAAAPGLAIFFIIVLGQFVSLIGTSLTSFALGVWVFQKTGSVSDFSLIATFATVPAILLLPVAGVVADRWDRRWIMILSDTWAACGTLLVAGLLWTNSLQIWHIYITASIGAIANAFQSPAYIAAIAQLVPKQYLGRANGIAQLGPAAGHLLAPLMGGALVIAIGLPGVVLIDFATFLFSITTLLLVKFPNTLFKKREEPFRQEFIGGLRYIFKRRGFVFMSIFILFVNFWMSIARVPITPLVLSFGSSVELGIVLAAQGIGLLTGGLVMSLWGGTRRRVSGIIGFVLLDGLSALALGLRPSSVWAVIGLFGLGVCTAFVNAHWHALLQTKVGLELQGRILAIERMLYWSMVPLGYILAGLLADKVFKPLMASDGPMAIGVSHGISHGVSRLIGPGPGGNMALVVVLGGVGVLITGVIGYLCRPVRFMEDGLPDAIPDAIILADKDALQEQADRQLVEMA